MKQLLSCLLALVAITVGAHSWDSDRLGDHIVIDLWPDGAPTHNGVDYAHLAADNDRDVKPQLHVFLPERGEPSRAVVICPGGAYGGLAMYHEGFEWKEFFTSRNIAALVLLYRLPHGHHQVPAEDVLEAIRTTGLLTDETETKLKSALDGYTADFVKAHS